MISDGLFFHDGCMMAFHDVTTVCVLCMMDMFLRR
jgi:hypothetical protein